MIVLKIGNRVLTLRTETNKAHLAILSGAVAALNAQSTALITAAAAGDLKGIIEAALLTSKTSAALFLYVYLIAYRTIRC